MEELLQSVAPYWIWLVLACILLAIEVLIVPSGFFLCIGTSAGVVAILAFMMPEISWLWMLGLFSLLMVASCGFWLAVVRRRRGADAGSADEEVLNVKTRQLVGYSGVLSEDMKGGRGRLRVNDSTWPIEADQDYPAGARVEVTEVRGITLTVKAAERKTREAAD